MIYEIIMSKGEKIRIDEDDLKKVKNNLSASLIQVKQGIINPSFMVMIVPTNEPDKVLKPIYEEGGDERTMKMVGEEEVNVLGDKMSEDVKKLTN